MGRQVLTGISPLVMEKCTCLPEYFNVTNDDVIEILEGKTLEEEMAVSELHDRKVLCVFILVSIGSTLKIC